MSKEQGNVHPSKLTKDAILEAVCELRFEAQPGFSGFLPGLLFSELKDLFSGIERMPGMELPPILMQIDPNMQFLATQRLKGDGLAVIVGDRVVGVTCTPYMGWAAYKALILKIWTTLGRFEFIGKLNRVSLKYVNMLDGHGNDLTEVTNVRVQIGTKAITSQPSQVRTELVDGDYTHIITIANPAATQLVATGEHREGCLVDVDVLCNAPAGDLLKNGEHQLDQLHSRAKDLFFDILSETALKARGPTYG
jgi:uncharacterized protein (TIGR04255 family)